MTNLSFKATLGASPDLAFGLIEPDGGNDLVFRAPPDLGHPVDLVFGDGSTVKPASYGSLSARVGVRAALVGVSRETVYGPLVATLGPVSMTAMGEALVNRKLPLSTQTSGAWHEGTNKPAATASRWSPSTNRRSAARTPWTEGSRRTARPTTPWSVATGQPATATGTWDDGHPVAAGTANLWGASASSPAELTASAWQTATPGPGVLTRGVWQELTRLAMTSLGAWGEGQRRAVSRSGSWAQGRRTDLGGVYPWNLGRRSDPGVSPRPSQPPEPPGHICYTPPPGGAVVVEFRDPATFDDTRLEFTCGDRTRSVVVPVRSVYIVQNSVSLKRVSDGLEIACLGSSLALDVDSWTWGFSAALPSIERPKIGRDEDLELWINGVPYRVRAESISTERSFGESSLRISGRGRAAVLAAPAAPVQTFGNVADRTAQQIVGDVLPLGWTVDWRLSDWTIPGGAWSYQGSSIEAALDVVTAVGGYLQPHATDQTLIARHRYAAAPWEWASLSPDFVLPSAVVLQEGVEWLSRPDYDRVYVSGTSQGVLANIKRAGTAGLILAPMVTHAALTAEPAVRQRGRAVLSDTGQQAHVTLRLPVLPSTGVILPGAMVEYVDGSATMRGVVRSTNVDARPVEVWQTLKVQTHV